MKRKKENKKERGITLIALVITIIVMLILVAVTVTTTINGGIFKKAGEAVSKTDESITNEKEKVDELLAEWDRIEEEDCAHQWGEWQDDGENMQKRTCNKCGKEETQKKNKYLPTTEYYEGYYADLNGDNKITAEADGIIYADLAHSKTGNWNEDTYSGYQYDAVDTSSLKSYEIVGQCEGLFGEEGEGGIIARVEDSGTQDRFYVMALKDLDDNQHYWYYNAYGNLKNPVSKDVIKFSEDSGKKNTSDMLNIYGKTVNEGGYGEKYTGGTYTDLWGMEALKTANQNGWFVPSRAEWSAFGAMLWTKKNITTQTCSEYLKDDYWSSSQYDTYIAWSALFTLRYARMIPSYGPYYSFYVRLSATF